MLAFNYARMILNSFMFNENLPTNNSNNQGIEF